MSAMSRAVEKVRAIVSSSLFISVILPVVLLVILYNLEPYFIEPPRAPSTIWPSRDILIKLLVLNAVTSGVVLLELFSYSFAEIILKDPYFDNRRILRYACLALFFIVLFLPGLILIHGILTELADIGSATEKELAGLIYLHYYIADTLYLLDLVYVPLFIILLWIGLMMHCGRLRFGKHFGLKNIVLTIVLTPLIQLLVLTTGSIVSLAVDAGTTIFTEPLHVLIYMRGWNQEIVETLLGTNDLAMTLVPSWGLIMGLMVSSILLRSLLTRLKIASSPT